MSESQDKLTHAKARGPVKLRAKGSMPPIFQNSNGVGRKQSDHLNSQNVRSRKSYMQSPGQDANKKGDTHYAIQDKSKFRSA